MTVRSFTDPENDRLVCSIGALSGMTYGCVAATVKRADLGKYDPYFSLRMSDGTPRLTVDCSVNDIMEWADGIGGASGGGDVDSIANWYTIVLRKATGSATPRYSIYNHTSATWQHGNMDTTVPNATAPGSGGAVAFAYEDATGPYFYGRIAARAAWSNSLGPGNTWPANSTGDAAIVAAHLEQGITNYLAATPSACWRFDQAAVTTAITDLTGNGANQTSRTGTVAVTGDDPPGFSFAAASSIPGRLFLPFFG